MTGQGTHVSPAGFVPNEWPIRSMSKVATIEYGISSPLDRSLKSGVRILTLPNVTQDGRFNLSEVTYVSTDELGDDSLLRKGDILFNWRSGSASHIGKTVLYDFDEPMTHVGFLLRIRSKGEVDAHYLEAYLKYVKQRGYFLGAKHQVNNTFNKGELSSVPVVVPPLPEQQKIAAILSTWDRAIELTEKLILAKQKRKQALMQQLLTGKVRLTGAEAKPWKEVKLRRLLTGRNEQIPNDGTHPLYSLTIEDGVTPKSERYNREFLVRDKSSKKYKIVYPGDIVFNPSNLRWGAIGIHNGVGPVLVSPIYEVLYVTDEDSTNKEFLFQQLSSSRQIQLFSGMAEGTLVERTAVKLPTFFACKILVPPTVEEQTRVARILSVTDSEIDFMSKRKAILSKQKKGLMQQLLTGKVRVNVDQETGEA